MSAEDVVNVRVMRRKLGRRGAQLSWVSHSALLLETADGKKHILEYMDTNEGTVVLNRDVQIDELKKDGTMVVAGVADPPLTNGEWSVQRRGTPVTGNTVADMKGRMEVAASANGKYDLFTNNCHMAQEATRRMLGLQVANPYPGELLRSAMTAGKQLTDAVGTTTGGSTASAALPEGFFDSPGLFPILESMHAQMPKDAKVIADFMVANNAVPTGSPEAAVLAALQQGKDVPQAFEGLFLKDPEAQKLRDPASKSVEAVVTAEKELSEKADSSDQIEQAARDEFEKAISAAHEMESEAEQLEQQTEDLANLRMGETAQEKQQRMMEEQSAAVQKDQSQTAKQEGQSRDQEQAVGEALTASATALQAMATALKSNPLSIAAGVALSAKALLMFGMAAKAKSKSSVHAAKAVSANQKASSAAMAAQQAGAKAATHGREANNLQSTAGATASAAVSVRQAATAKSAVPKPQAK